MSKLFIGDIINSDGVVGSSGQLSVCCPTEFKNEDVLANRYSADDLMCKICQHNFSTPHNLRQHMEFKHNGIEKVSRPKILRIPLTEEEYNKKVKANRDGVKYILCPFCFHYPFASRKYLFQHLTLKHPSTSLYNSISETNQSHSIDSVNVGPEYTHLDGRRSYSNEFKAKVIEEIDKGVARKTISKVYDVPIRTMEKWANNQRDLILITREDSDLGKMKRIKTN